STACYTQNRSIILKRPGKTAYDMFRGRAPDISYLYVFGCLGVQHQKTEDDEAISQTSTEGDAINFNENSDDQPAPIISPSAEAILQNPVPQDRWSREKHIELVNIIGEPLAGITTRSRVKDSDVASTHKCLYVNFLSKIEPKKLIEALEEEGWV
ncbi:hypothetical protein Tco_0113772, partial [Tanacetum coccineum]